MEKKTLEQNILIAKFMGATVDKYGDWTIPNVSIPYQGYERYGDQDPCLDFKNKCKDYEMQYHKSWDWIMSVVEKIRSLGNTVNISTNYFFKKVSN